MARSRRPLPSMVLEGPIFRPGRSVSARSALQSIPSPDVPDSPACRLEQDPCRVCQALGPRGSCNRETKVCKKAGHLERSFPLAESNRSHTWQPRAESPVLSVHLRTGAGFESSGSSVGPATIHKQYSICNFKLQSKSSASIQSGVSGVAIWRAGSGQGSALVHGEEFGREGGLVGGG